MNEGMHLNPGASGTAGRCLLLTGARRTGTSLMANLLYSTREVELSFEPPALRALFPLLGALPAEHWRYLFDAYLFEEFLVGALAGRKLNFNRNDDSSVYAALDASEVDSRLAVGHRQADLAPRAMAQFPAVKLPDMNCYLSSFRQVAPDHTAIVMLRNPNSLIQSLLRMGWFDDKRLSGVSADWPHRQVGDVPAPHWVEDDFLDQWATGSPLERSSYYYCRMYESVLSEDSLHFVSFDDFIINPEAHFAKLIDVLGLHAGLRTQALLDNIHDPDTKYATQIDGLSKAWRDRSEAAYESCLDKALIG